MIRFMVDAQLPPALVRLLRARGFEAEHVHEVGLGGAPDQAIWQRAEARALVIITKDEDFPLLAGRMNGGPPVVWVRIGNTTNRALLQWFDPMIPGIVQALEKGECLIELI